MGWEHFLEFSDVEQAPWTSEFELGEGLGIPSSPEGLLVHSAHGVTYVGSAQSETLELTYLSRNSDSQLLI